MVTITMQCSRTVADRSFRVGLDIELVYYICKVYFILWITRKLTAVHFFQQRIPREIYWYYMVELGYYVSEMGWIFYGVRRTVSCVVS